MGSSTFTYDLVSRLKTSTLNLNPSVPNDPTDVWQDYTYDSFGNIQSMTGTVGRNTPTDKSTNRLSGTAAAYDTAGNLTNWNGAAYQYDPFNQMVRFTSGGEDRLYVYPLIRQNDSVR